VQVKVQSPSDAALAVRAGAVLDAPDTAAMGSNLQSAAGALDSSLISSSLRVDSWSAPTKQFVAPAAYTPSSAPAPIWPRPVSGSSGVVTTTLTAAPIPEGEETTEDGDDGLIAIPMGLGLLFIIGAAFAFVTIKRRQAQAAVAAIPAGGTGPGPLPFSPPAAPVSLGRASILREDEIVKAHALSEEGLDATPGHWNRKAGSGKGSVTSVASGMSHVPTNNMIFDDLVYVKHDDLAKFQGLLSYTYRPIPTQDRLCPNNTCSKQRGGCPCVQRGGDPGLPTGYEVKRVIRVEDSGMFERYVQRRKAIRGARAGGCDHPDTDLFTKAALDHVEGLPDVLGELDDSINEVFLWHGTNIRAGLSIAQNDFNLDWAGKGAGTMYGKGLYFAESCTKADEYAKSENDGHYRDIRALLLCRVCVGKFHYVLDRDETAIDVYTKGESDSTIGDRAKSVHTYREIVIYDADQVYPEYLVIYQRCHGGKAPELPSKRVPFQLELPVYWVNVGKNPYTEPFRIHYHVRSQIRALVERLARGCSNSNKNMKVRNVRRVEDSELWTRYIHWKAQLTAGLEASGMKFCKPPNELDQMPDSGHTVTQKVLEEMNSEEAISVENMHVGLNELLLWHGTDRVAADQIADKGFLVGSAKHGRRFGNGAYLAEDIDKSLGYAPDDRGVRHMLLCRAVCGHMWYTEKNWDEYAHNDAQKNRKNSILANPNKTGPREYILFEEAQIYPEYMLEISL